MIEQKEQAGERYITPICPIHAGITRIYSPWRGRAGRAPHHHASTCAGVGRLGEVVKLPPVCFPKLPFCGKHFCVRALGNTVFAEGREHFVYAETARSRKKEKDFPFLESLLRFVYLDIWSLEDEFKRDGQSVAGFLPRAWI